MRGREIRSLSVIILGLLTLANYAEADATSPLDVVINEIAWMGTVASPYDEWIEFYNNTDSSIDIGNWSIYGADTGQCLNFSIADGNTTTTVPAHGYLIYANHEDDVRDSDGTNMVDIWDATISMSNTSPGQVILYDAPDCGGNVIDTANQATGGWFAGDASERKTMERKDPTASGTDSSNWGTSTADGAAMDSSGTTTIKGTPKAWNSVANRRPTANAGPDQTVNVGDTVQLDGSGSSDPDGDPLSYSWSFISEPAGSAAVLSDPAIVNPTFVADVAGDYMLELTVDDGRGGTDSDQVTITAAVRKGDVNGDGQIDMQDAILAAKFALGLLTPSEWQRKAADVVPPCGAIDARDVVRIAEVALGIRDESVFTCSGGSGASLGMAIRAGTQGLGKIQLHIADKEILPGGRATINVSSSSTLGGIQVGPEGSLSFDPAVIRIKAIRSVPPFQVLAHEIDNEVGKAKFMAIAMGKPTSGEIIELEVEAVGQEGESTVIKLASDMVLDDEGNKLEVEVAEGRLDLGQATPLRVDRVLSIPNPVRNGGSVRFLVEGQGIKGVQVRIYDLSGGEVFGSGWVAGETFEWNLMSNRGRVVANGIYLYIVTIRGFGEDKLVRSSVKKLVVLR